MSVPSRAGDSTLIHHNNAPQLLVVVPANDPVTINIQSFAFSPNNIQITTGTMVTWTNLDGAPHTSSSLTAVWDSGTLSQNQSFSFTFNSTGTFQYRCNIHTSMLGTITVVDPPTSTATTTATVATVTATATPTTTVTQTNTPTNTATNTPNPARPDTIGLYVAVANGQWLLRNSNSPGAPDITSYFFGNGGWIVQSYPVAGDWDGDGIDTLGTYQSERGLFNLSNSNTTPGLAYEFYFGNPGDTPFSGRWDNVVAHDGVGVYRSSNGILYLKRELTTGFDDYYMVFGNPGDQGIGGDWDGDGFDSVGIYRPGNQTWYLNNDQTSGTTFSEIDFTWPVSPNSKIFTGDWDGDGTTNVGFFEEANGMIVLHTTNATTGANIWIAYGPIFGGARPIAGKWTAGSKPPALLNINVGKPGGSNNLPDGSGD